MADEPRFFSEFWSSVEGKEVLKDSIKEEFMRIVTKQNNRFDNFLMFFNKAERIIFFLNANEFCKSYLSRNITLEEFIGAYDLLSQDVSLLKEQRSLNCCVLWRIFYLKAFNSALSLKEFKLVDEFSKKTPLCDRASFLNFIEWNEACVVFLGRPITHDEFNKTKYFNKFINGSGSLKQKDLLALNKAFLMLGSEKVWFLYDLVEKNDKQIENFRALLLLLFRWNGKMSFEWQSKDAIALLLKADQLYLDNGNELTYEDFESIYTRISLCPDISLEKLIKSSSNSKMASYASRSHASTVDSDLNKRNVTVIEVSPISIDVKAVAKSSSKPVIKNDDKKEGVVKNNIVADSKNRKVAVNLFSNTGRRSANGKGEEVVVATNKTKHLSGNMTSSESRAVLESGEKLLSIKVTKNRRSQGVIKEGFCEKDVVDGNGEELVSVKSAQTGQLQGPVRKNKKAASLIRKLVAGTVIGLFFILK